LGILLIMQITKQIKKDFFLLRAIKILFLTTVVGFVMTSCYLNNERTPLRILVPEGYVGWVKFEYTEGTPLPQMEDGYYLLKVPPSGVLQIFPQVSITGWARDELYYYTGENRKRLPLKMLISGPSKIVETKGVYDGYYYGFIGTEEQREKYGKKFNSNGEPIIGDINSNIPNK